MKIRKSIQLAFLALALMTGGASSYAQLHALTQGTQVTAPAKTGASEKLPSAKEVRDRFVKELGGKEAIQKHESYTLTGRLEVPAAGVSGDITAYAMRPDRQFARITIPGYGEITSGYDGAVAWRMDPSTGPMVLTGRMLEQALREADMDSQLKPESEFASVEVVEKTTFEGQDAYKLKYVTKTGETFFEYYSVASGLQIGGEYDAETPMGVMKVVTTMKEYKEFEGMRMPTHVEATQGPMKQIVKVGSVSTSKVDPAVFALPPQIKALVEKPKN